MHIFGSSDPGISTSPDSWIFISLHPGILGFLVSPHPQILGSLYLYVHRSSDPSISTSAGPWILLSIHPQIIGSSYPYIQVSLDPCIFISPCPQILRFSELYIHRLLDPLQLVSSVTRDVFIGKNVRIFKNKLCKYFPLLRVHCVECPHFLRQTPQIFSTLWRPLWRMSIFFKTNSADIFYTPEDVVEDVYIF